MPGLEAETRVQPFSSVDATLCLRPCTTQAAPLGTEQSNSYAPESIRTAAVDGSQYAACGAMDLAAHAPDLEDLCPDGTIDGIVSLQTRNLVGYQANSSGCAAYLKLGCSQSVPGHAVCHIQDDSPYDW